MVHALSTITRAGFFPNMKTARLWIWRAE